MDSDKLQVRRETKRKMLIAEMDQFSTLQEWADATGTTRQNVEQKIKRYNLKTEWNNNRYKNRFNMTSLPSESASVYCIYFDDNKKYKYYGSTRNTKNRFLRHVSDLKTNNHFCFGLQNDFNSYGIKKMIFKVIKYVSEKQLLIVERELIEKDFHCYNKSLPFTTKHEKIIRRNEYAYKKNHNKPRPKSRYFGVVWNWRAQLWVANPRIQRKYKYLGYFKKEIDAKRAIEKFFNIKIYGKTYIHL